MPENATVTQGESIIVTITITNASNLFGVEVHLTYDDGLSVGDLVPGTCASYFIALSDASDGQMDFAAARGPLESPVNGDCDVVTFTVTGDVSDTHAIIAFDRVILASPEGSELPAITRDGEVTVVAPAP
jgi:hypothetical protein